jgi:ribose 5-phosphate isomerase B
LKFIYYNDFKIVAEQNYAGFKQEVAIAELKTIVKNFGTHASDSVDYPDFAHPVSSAVESNN